MSLRSLPVTVPLAVALACSSASNEQNERDLYGTGGSGATGAGGAAAGGGGPGGFAGTGGSAASGGGLQLDSGSGGSADAGCASASKTADRLPPLLMLVVDTSGSMNDSAPGGGGSKWQVTRSALGTAMAQMPNDYAVGVVFYPDTNPLFGSCIDSQIDVSLGLLDQNQRASLQQSFQAQSAEGGTPTHDGYLLGLNHVVASTLPGNKFVVLITDGIPTYALGCNGTGSNPINAQQTAALVSQVQNAAAGGVRTFVVGSPGSEAARNTLSQMASVGGTASPGCSDSGPNYCHFDMTTAPDLGQAFADALAAISGAALSCSYPIPAPPDGSQLDLGKVNVVYTPGGGGPPQDIFKDPSASDCTTGWQYSADKSQILLCGATCDTVKADTQGKVDIVFGCETKIE
ncbi:MAG: VWA domain-containing protein [Polyangiaceae bacterium]|nr:VWA domain-containing protein [Polyangiaceae bacterium]